jgi:hypothetical protein
MNRPAWNAAALAWILPFLAAFSLRTSGASTNLVFASGSIACQVVAPGDAIPQGLLTALPVAMNSAVEHIGAPAAPAHLVLRLQEPPSWYKRFKALFRSEAAAVQEGDEIRVQAGDDPLKLAFRIGHELSHWLACKRHPVRPPLWLDEGLAQLVAADAAATCARTCKQSLARPRPPRLDQNLFGLEELAALAEYPRSADRSAAFYWQAEALVGGIRKRLGPGDFATYLGLLSVSRAPGWQVPLRERWYFSDWDFGWLAEQIRPKTASP